MSDYIDRSVILKEIEDQLNYLRIQARARGTDGIRQTAMFALINAYGHVKEVINKLPAAEPAVHPQLHWHTVGIDPNTGELTDLPDIERNTIMRFEDDIDDGRLFLGVYDHKLSWEYGADEFVCDAEPGHRWVYKHDFLAFLDSMEPPEVPRNG